MVIFLGMEHAVKGMNFSSEKVVLYINKGPNLNVSSLSGGLWRQSCMQQLQCLQAASTATITTTTTTTLPTHFARQLAALSSKALRL